MLARKLLAGTRFAALRYDEAVLSIIFAALILMTIAVLGRDLMEQIRAAPSGAMLGIPREEPAMVPFLPSARPGVEPAPQDRLGSDASELQQPMTVELTSGGRLEAIGAITPGTFERFKAEIDKRSEYVKTVVLNSPGGSVQDALAMSRLIRERGFDTLVEADALCASSCPLIFSGGVERVVEAGGSLGVHQMIALLPVGATIGQGEGMARAQSVSAECQRLLLDMGVDPRVWVHAMETRPEQIFYFTDEEALDLKLATRGG